MKGIILAAGRGSRMGALTDERPKCLTVMAGRTLLEWQMSALRAAGVNDIAIVTGYKKELLEPLADKTFVNERWAETNMLMSLACAAEWLRTDRCIVSYSDIFYSVLAIRSLMQCQQDICITYDKNWLKLWALRFGDPLSDAERFQLASDGSIAVIGGKAASASEIEGQYMGLLSFTPQGWRNVEKYIESSGPGGVDRLDMTGLLARLIQSGHKIFAAKYEGEWGEVDSATDLSLYERLVAEGQLKLS